MTEGSGRRVRAAMGVSVALALLATAMPAARAEEDKTDANGITAPSIATSMPHNGDPSGGRKALASRGITYNFIYTNDLLANLRGGNRRGVIDQGKLEASLSIDFEKLAGLQGLSFYANAFEIHNTGRIRRDYVGGINTIAAIEAVPTTRLSEMWFEQKFWNGNASLRAGQLAADTEFFFAGLSALFLQSDWPTIAASNMPSGGPAYPLSTPGARLKVNPTSDISLLFAIFNGDPAGPGAGDEQLRNRYGLNFRVQDPPLLMAEAQFRTNQGKADTGLARTLKVGGWAHAGSFNDQRFANDMKLLADPTSSGVPLRHLGTSGVYGVVEQQVYRPAGGDAESGIALFGRASFSPSDRNLISLYADGGIVFSGMIPGRPDDKFGASVIYARYSDSVRAFDRDQIAFSGLPGVVRDFETNLELTYMAQIIPGWTVQPVLTYIWHPGGDATRNAMVTGVRSIWRY
ncbi:MAG: carbohydrate porin [Variibacter sp.]|nr:carbohydrate porin [Variibacter sp.]